MQRKTGRLVGVKASFEERELFQLASSVQSRLATVTQENAPSLRYSIVLDELQQETQRRMDRPAPSLSTRPNAKPGVRDQSARSLDDNIEKNTTSSRGAQQINTYPNILEWDTLGDEFTLDSDLWLQLDHYPFRKHWSYCYRLEQC